MKRLLALAATAGIAVCGLPMTVASASAATTVTASHYSTPLTAPVLGVDLYAKHNYSAATVRADGLRMISYIKNVLKADAVGIVWQYSAPSDRSNVVRRTSATLSPRNVRILTKLAMQQGLQVEYRPIIMVRGRGIPWEGLISPRNQRKWFNSYYKAELPYIRAAQSLGISEFVAATEMTKLNSSRLWRPFFRKISRVYKGVVSYTSYDQDFVHGRLLPVKYLGTDMYHRLKLSPSASVGKVTRAWERFFRPVRRSVLRRTAIDETGIAARAGAYLHPERLGTRGRLDEKIQANWFTAACRTVVKYHMRGVFFWKVNLTDNPAHPAKSLSTFEGRKGAQAIANCASILHVG